MSEYLASLLVLGLAMLTVVLGVPALLGSVVWALVKLEDLVKGRGER